MTAGIIAQPLSESGHSYLEDMSVASILASPDFGQKLFMCDDSAGVAGEQTEYSVFGWRQKDLAVGYLHLMLGEVDRQVL